jgi:hypothetical protein
VPSDESFNNTVGALASGDGVAEDACGVHKRQLKAAAHAVALLSNFTQTALRWKLDIPRNVVWKRACLCLSSGLLLTSNLVCWAIDTQVEKGEFTSRTGSNAAGCFPSRAVLQIHRREALLLEILRLWEVPWE